MSYPTKIDPVIDCNNYDLQGGFIDVINDAPPWSVVDDLDELPQNEKPFLYRHRKRLATDPPVRQLALFHPYLPRSIVVQSNTRQDITVGTIMKAIYCALRELCQPIFESIVDKRDCEHSTVWSEPDEGMLSSKYLGDCTQFRGLIACHTIRGIMTARISLRDRAGNAFCCSKSQYFPGTAKP
ncbi:unnamed protein product [Somion occarium]|uniref:DUF6699 domain-containing protein n=1 Tax=Somion occarium TaxID=3059160 RepID=A0ABP1CWN7_9APHY